MSIFQKTGNIAGRNSLRMTGDKLVVGAFLSAVPPRAPTNAAQERRYYEHISPGAMLPAVFERCRCRRVFKFFQGLEIFAGDSFQRLEKIGEWDGEKVFT